MEAGDEDCGPAIHQPFAWKRVGKLPGQEASVAPGRAAEQVGWWAGVGRDQDLILVSLD